MHRLQELQASIMIGTITMGLKAAKELENQMHLLCH